MTGVRGELLIVVLGGVDDPTAAASRVLAHFAAGPVVVGPSAASLEGAAGSAREALDAAMESGSTGGHELQYSELDALLAEN